MADDSIGFGEYGFGEYVFGGIDNVREMGGRTQSILKSDGRNDV